MLDGGYEGERIHNLGETVQPSRDRILDEIAAMIPGDRGVLIGMVNIHTEQAEMLLEYFAAARGAHHDEELEASLDAARLPVGVQRVDRLRHRRLATGPRTDA